MPKIIFEADMDEKDISREDSGCALIWDPSWEVLGDDPSGPDTGTFVRFQSWDDAREHVSFKRFLNKKVRVTVEVIGVLDRLVEATSQDEEDVDHMLSKWNDLDDLSDAGLHVLRHTINEELRRRAEEKERSR